LMFYVISHALAQGCKVAKAQASACAVRFP